MKKSYQGTKFNTVIKTEISQEQKNYNYHSLGYENRDTPKKEKQDANHHSPKWNNASHLV